MKDGLYSATVIMASSDPRATGTLIGRSLPALAVTCGVYLALRFTFTFWVRAHYMSAVTGIFVVLAAAAVAVMFAILRRRDA